MSFHDLKPMPYKRVWIVVAVLVISLGLRWSLIFKGGQFYFSDEHRYDDSRAAADLLLQGRITDAFSQLVTFPEHLGFKTIGIIPAMIEKLTGPSLVMPAMFFGVFSVLNLYLIFLLALRAGVSDEEALLTLFLSAASMSLLYYARHLMPYDLGMFFGLWALYVAITREPNAKTALMSGGLGFVCFITYNGYWVLAGFAMLVHVFKKRDSVRQVLFRALFTATGFMVSMAFLVLLAATYGINMITEYGKFAGTISQGSYSEGWRLPFDYLWAVEHAYILILVLLSGYVLIPSALQKKTYWKLWAIAIVFVYLCLLIPSVVLHSFVVYGRLARQIMPFLVLLSAVGLARLWRETSFRIAGGIMLLIFMQATWNYLALYKFSYPRDFVLSAQAQFPDFEFSEKRMEFGAPIVCRNNGYLIQNAKYFLEVPEADLIMKGDLLLSVPHASNFIPYLYEGYTADQRQKFQDLKITLRFYKIDGLFLSDSSIKNCYVNQDVK